MDAFSQLKTSHSLCNHAYLGTPTCTFLPPYACLPLTRSALCNLILDFPLCLSRVLDLVRPPFYVPPPLGPPFVSSPHLSIWCSLLLTSTFRSLPLGLPRGFIFVSPPCVSPPWILSPCVSFPLSPFFLKLFFSVSFSSSYSNLRGFAVADAFEIGFSRCSLLVERTLRLSLGFHPRKQCGGNVEAMWS